MKTPFTYVSPQVREVAFRYGQRCLCTSIQNPPIQPIDEDDWGNY